MALGLDLVSHTHTHPVLLEMLQVSFGEDTDLTWVKSVTLSWPCLEQTKPRDRS